MLSQGKGTLITARGVWVVQIPHLASVDTRAGRLLVVPRQGWEFQLSRDTAVGLALLPLGHSEIFDCPLGLL